MKISIIGLGYVGSVSAACLANKGHQVIGVDLHQTKVDLINAGKAIIIEKDLAELTANGVATGNLRATQNINEAVLATDITFVCVGTPSTKQDGLDLTYVRQACEEIGKAIKEKSSYHTIACRSTMFAGSMRNLVIPTIEKASGKKANRDFGICFNPEFMMEGTAVHDFAHPPKNVVGAEDQRVFDLMTALNLSTTNMPTICIGIEAAELIKYCDNIWHALKVGFANEVGKVCKALNIDSHQVMDVFCQDTKLNLSPYYLKPGFAFGGSCLPKDLRAFMYEAKKLNVEVPIINAVLPSNQMHIENALQMIMDQGNKHIGILGFSFKANTDDLRESPTLELIERLLGKGYELTLYDKNVAKAKAEGANKDYILKQIPHISRLMVDSVAEVINKAKTIVIGNKNQEFASVISQVPAESVIIDLVRIIDDYPQSEQYQGICW